jgi:RNA polymerase sigma-70 factor (ECF subfamily)
LNSQSARIAPEILVLSSSAEGAVARRPAEPLPDEPTDEAVLCLIKDGETESLGCLFRRYARLVRSIGQRILQDPAEADDLVQEVFLYIYRKCALYDPLKGSARGWVIQVVYTQALLRRRQLNSRRITSFESLESDRRSGPEDRNEASCYDRPLESLFGWSGWKKVWDGLTECQRETLRLHFYEGCTFAEIAEKLGQSYVNIRHHYYRGLEKLRRHAVENDLNWP